MHAKKSCSTYKLMGFLWIARGGMGFLSCITSHSRAYCCQMQGFELYFCARCDTGSGQGSRVVSGAGYVGVGRAHSSVASRVFDVHLRCIDCLFISSSKGERLFAFSARTNVLCRCSTNARISRLKSCGRGDLTIGFAIDSCRVVITPCSTILSVTICR